LTAAGPVGNGEQDRIERIHPPPIENLISETLISSDPHREAVGPGGVSAVVGSCGARVTMTRLGTEGGSPCRSGDGGVRRSGCLRTWSVADKLVQGDPAMNAKPLPSRHSLTAHWPPPRSAVESGQLQAGARHERLVHRLSVVLLGKRVAAAAAPSATLAAWGTSVGPRDDAPSWYRNREPSMPGRVFSPGPWAVPTRKIASLTWAPPGGVVPRLDLVPGWVLRLFYAPFIDRWAFTWMWCHGAFEVLESERRQRQRRPEGPDSRSDRRDATESPRHSTTAPGTPMPLD
jgi:hypothetical protein